MRFSHTFAFDGLHNHTQQVAGKGEECQCCNADLEEGLNLAGLALVPWIAHCCVFAVNIQTSTLVLARCNSQKLTDGNA